MGKSNRKSHGSIYASKVYDGNITFGFLIEEEDKAKAAEYILRSVGTGKPLEVNIFKKKKRIQVTFTNP